MTKTHTIAVRVDEDLHRQMRAAQARTGDETLATWIRRALRAASAPPPKARK